MEVSTAVFAAQAAWPPTLRCVGEGRLARGHAQGYAERWENCPSVNPSSLPI